MASIPGAFSRVRDRLAIVLGSLQLLFHLSPHPNHCNQGRTVDIAAGSSCVWLFPCHLYQQAARNRAGSRSLSTCIYLEIRFPIFRTTTTHCTSILEQFILTAGDLYL